MRNKEITNGRENKRQQERRIMYSTISSGALMGVHAYVVGVEVDIATGLPGFSMVGSLAGEVRESKERVQVALKNAGLDIPPMRITVNLSPADRRKEGTAFDLPIAVGMLEALEYFPFGRAKDILFLGELGLNGEIRKVRGVLPIVKEAMENGIRECIVPKENVGEGAVVSGMTVRGAEDIRQVLCFLMEKKEKRNKILPQVHMDVEKLFQKDEEYCRYDFSDVMGQVVAKRAAEIAAAGFHSLLMSGPPGAGKSMIAKRIPSILPPLTVEESLEVTSVVSVAGLMGERSLITERPFQSPHHSISLTAMTGGNRIPKPGVISLAHRGVLFLDELPEFSRTVLDALRQPLEDREIQVSRLQANVTYPADFMLVCAMNPCPCGYYPDLNRCRCSEMKVEQYMGKISGPILDRIDLCVELQRVDVVNLQTDQQGKEESSIEIRKRVETARAAQEERFRGTLYQFNADVDTSDIEKLFPLGDKEKKCMENLYQSMQLGARAYHRIWKVGRTIADLAGEEKIREEHLMEAACYRPILKYWRGRKG